ncbi:DMT family transporter [Salinisphaera japonica]|uniref:Guanidinium exporter n=1 Tax=Salinisphaera japonica YTM-1 TaxID=1209778 RepID=A0A423PN02_9GAMM|nr:SMR family transporter [Salinisphaera japonica]ROO26970.1 multidrug resistance protein SMR [Salinisphaera japonica YTM-1]
MLAWAALVAAGVFEVVGVQGFQMLTRSRIVPGLARLVAGFGIGLTLLHMAAQQIPLGIAYAVFSAIGTIGSTLVGVFVWHETLGLRRGGWLCVVIGAIIGLKLCQ